MTTASEHGSFHTTATTLPVLLQTGVITVGTSSYLNGEGSATQEITQQQNLCGMALIVLSQVRTAHVSSCVCVCVCVCMCLKGGRGTQGTR